MGESTIQMFLLREQVDKHLTIFDSFQVKGFRGIQLKFDTLLSQIKIDGSYLGA
jgi:hypothetical protein